MSLINPFLPKGRAHWAVSFRHPVKGRPVSKSLMTLDETEAGHICLDIQKQVRDKALGDIENPRLGLLHQRAVEVFHGRPYKPKTPTLPVDGVLVETLKRGNAV